MTSDELSQLEHELQVRLPQAYRQAIAPFAVKPLAGNTDTALWDDVGELAKLNHGYRGGEIGGGRWSSRFFVPGQVLGDPSVYALDLSNETVLWLDHGVLPDDPSGGIPLNEWLAERIDELKAICDEEGIADSSESEKIRKGHRRADVVLLAGCGVAILTVLLVLVAALSL